jgi:CheY-like chemotaxis protein
MTIRRISWLVNIVIICFILLTVLSHLYVDLIVLDITILQAEGKVKIAILVYYMSLIALLSMTSIKLMYNYFFIVKPLLSITKLLQSMVIDEKTDIGKRIEVSCKNEVGTLADYFNTAFDNICELAGAVKNKINAYTSTGFELSANMSKTSMSIKKISMNLNKIKGLVAKQENEATDARKSVEMIKENAVNKKVSMSAINELLGKTESFINTNSETTACLEEILTAIGQVNISLNRINDMGNENNSNFDVLKEEMDKFIISGGSRNKKILLVDDDPIHLAITENMLKSDYDVITATSGNEALNMFYQGFVPTIILLDLVMPDMDGWDTFEKIRAMSELHHVPIAFFTSSFEIEDIKRAFDMGVDEYISKPVEKHELMKTVQAMLKK